MSTVSTWKRPRSVLRISMGICPDCADRDAAPGGKRCAHCRDMQNAKHRAKYEADRKAGIPRFTRHKYDTLAAEKRMLREQRKRNGQCIQCGIPVRKFQRCAECRVGASEAKSRWREKQKARAKANRQEIDRLPVVEAKKFRVRSIRAKYVERYNLTSMREKRMLDEAFLYQLERCKDEPARRLLLGVSR